MLPCSGGKQQPYDTQEKYTVANRSSCPERNKEIELGSFVMTVVLTH